MPRPDLAAWLSHRIRDQLTPQWEQLQVGKQRPANIVNLQGPFVRVLCTGGPESFQGHIWAPGVVLECWADTVDDAEDLNAAVTDILRACEGLVRPGFWHLSRVLLHSVGAFTPSDGHPVVTTTATLTVALP